MRKKNISLILRILISGGLIGYFILTLSSKYGGMDTAIDRFSASFSNIPIELLILALSLHFVGFCLTSLRWKILLSAQAVNASFSRLFLYYFMASFFNTFLPSTIGGDTVRAIHGKKMTGKTSTSVMVVLVERLTGVMAMVLIAAAGLTLTFFQSTENYTQAWLLLSLTLGIFILIILLAHPNIAPRILRISAKILPVKIQTQLEHAYTAIENIYKNPRKLVAAQLVSIVFQFNMVAYYFIIAKALDQHPQPLEFMMKIPVVIFLLMTIPTINGLGVRTAGFKGLMGFAAIYALAVESIDVVLRVTVGLVGGLLFLFHRGSSKEIRSEQEGYGDTESGNDTL